MIKFYLSGVIALFVLSKILEVNEALEVIPGVDEAWERGAEFLLIVVLIFAVATLYKELKSRIDQFMQTTNDYRESEANQTKAFEDMNKNMEKQIEVGQKQMDILKRLEQIITK